MRLMATDDPTPPEWQAPPLATDAHFHVFGPAARFSTTSDLRYAMPETPLEDYLEMAKRFGFERFVFVQPSAYGRDNSCLLDALERVGTAVGRGIVDIDENAPEAELARMHALGVRGVRINVPPGQPADRAIYDAIVSRIERLAARCAELGWHLDFLTPGRLTDELLQTTLKTIPVDFTLGHFGLFQAKDGFQQPGFLHLLDALRGGNPHCWVKLSGVYRISDVAGYTDTAMMARAIVGAASNRVIWGSDWPHVQFEGISTAELFNVLGQWLPNDGLRQRALVENPAKLYGFDA